MRSARILIVEDNALVAQGTQAMVNQAGYEVAGCTASGEAAVALAARLQPDLVLMDIRLRGQMDGVEAARRIRAQQAVPVIYVSAYIDELTLRRADATFPSGYLSKPVLPGALRNAIELALRQAPRNRQPPIQAPRLVVADDNCMTRAILRDALSAQGYQVTVARDGAEALSEAQAVHPDLMILDVQMPVLDGLEVMRQVRRAPDLAATPIIALTALAEPADRRRCLEAGANEYLSKPVSLVTLFTMVETCLERGYA